MAKVPAMGSEPRVMGGTVTSAVRAGREPLPDREVGNPFFRYLMHLGLPLSISLVLHLGVVGFLALKSFGVLTRSRMDVGQWEGTVVEAADFSGAFQWTDDNVLPVPADDPHETLLDLDSLTPLPTVNDFARAISSTTASSKYPSEKKKTASG